MDYTLFASIDLGSYEIGMKIYSISKAKGMEVLDCKRFPLELGKTVYADHYIDIEMIDLVCDVLNDFKTTMKEYSVKDYRACATGTFRELKNPYLVSEQIFQRTGIKIDVLSSAEQHFLGYKSISANESNFKKVIEKGTAILDIGGGSVQVSLFDKDTLVSTQNLKIGSMLLREKLRPLEKTFLYYDQLIEQFIENDISCYKRLHLKDREIKNIIFTGNFLTETIFRDKKNDNIFTYDYFIKRYKHLINSNINEICEELQIDYEYASLLVPALVVCKRFIEIFNAEQFWVPGVCLMDGVAFDYGEQKKLIKSSHDFENDIIVSSYNIAKRYGSGKNHINGTSKLALGIYDSMKKIHGMGSRERLLLNIACILHDCGKYISMGYVSQCSYDIVMSTDIIGLSVYEREIIASTIRYNTTDFLYAPRGHFEMGFNKEKYLIIAKLSAILRLANAMDRSHYQKVQGLKAVLKDRRLNMILDSTDDISLELGLLSKNIEFFQEVFGVKLILRRKKKN